VDPSENGEIIVKVFGSIRICILVAVMCALSAPAFGQTRLEATKQQTSEMAAEHDGQHDFDFLFGNWKVHCRRLLHPLTGSNKWVEFQGTNVVHPMWDGRATVDEFEADTLRSYRGNDDPYLQQ
jgi:hypothetical protein